MRPAPAARALAALQLLGTASALVVVGEDVGRPAAAPAEGRLSLAAREKLVEEEWSREVQRSGEAHALRQGKKGADEEDWEKLEEEDWARMMAKKTAPAAGPPSPPGNAAAAATQPASKGQGLLTWMRTKLRRTAQPTAPAAGAADARPQTADARPQAPEPITHSSLSPTRGGGEAAPSGGDEAAPDTQDQEEREAARQALVDNFLDNLDHPSDSVLESIDKAFPTTTDAFPDRAIKEEPRAEPRVETTTTEGVTKPPPVFCPNPDQVREQEAREAGQKRGGQDVGYETHKEGCSPEERLWTAKFLGKTFDEQYRSKVAEVFSQEETSTYLSIGDMRQLPLLGNWLHHAGSASDVEGGIHLVNVALDKGGMTGCGNLKRSMEDGSAVRLTCLSLAGWLPDSYFNGNSHMGGCDYNMILWTKPNILKAAVEASDHAVLMIDVDVIVYKDLLRLGRQKFARNADKKIITGREKNGQANTGTVYATRRDSMPWLEAWVKANNICLNGQMGDQSAMQHAIHYEPGMRLALETFQRYEVGECAIKGKYATHYNCVGNKVKTMKENEEWAEGVPTKPEEIAGSNPVIALHKAEAAA